MEKTFSKPKVMAGIATTLLAVAVVTLLFTSNANKSLKSSLSKEKLSSEKLLAENLTMDKKIARYNEEIDHFNFDMNNLKGKNAELDRLLADSRNALSEKQAELTRLVKANAGKKQIEKKLEELNILKDNYEKQITALHNQVTTLGMENSELKVENNLLSQKMNAIEAQNKELADNNSLLKLMVADDYLVEGVKGKKDKLTLSARKTNKIVLQFDIPVDTDVKLGFSIITPDGKTIERTDKDISSVVLDPGQDASVPGSAGAGSIKLNKRIKMEYNPKGKLSRGVYKIEIYNNDNYLTSCQVHLK